MKVCGAQFRTPGHFRKTDQPGHDNPSRQCRLQSCACGQSVSEARCEATDSVTRAFAPLLEPKSAVSGKLARPERGLLASRQTTEGINMKTAMVCAWVRLTILAAWCSKVTGGTDRDGIAVSGYHQACLLANRTTWPGTSTISRPKCVTRITDTSDPARFRMSG